MSSQFSPAQKRVHHQHSFQWLPCSYTALDPSFPIHPGSSTAIDFPSEGSITVDDQPPLWTSEELANRHRVTSMDSLPDDVLLAIFKDIVRRSSTRDSSRTWRPLVRVCRRWRSLVFGSPAHLGLLLVCTTKTPARDALDIWPSIPLVVVYESYPKGSVDNTIAGLERTDRVREVYLFGVASSDSEMILAAMQRPFPELRLLWVDLSHKMGTVLFVPDSVLGGSAPHLESLRLISVIFPGLTKLLLSATHLVELELINIPHSGYFPPDTMVTTLSILTSLSRLTLTFKSPRSCPDRESRRFSPSTRPVFSALSRIRFGGVSEYLEDLVACIDAPQLSVLYITFFNDIVFDTSQLIKFIGRTPLPRELEKAHLIFWDLGAEVDFSQTPGYEFGGFRVEISCRGSDWQVSNLEQVCTSCLLPSSKLEDLYIHEAPYPTRQLGWKDNIENGLWLELLRPFTAVKNLYLSDKFATHIAAALQELVGDRTTEVLPALRDIYLSETESSGPAQEGIGRLVAARQVASRPITVSRWANWQEEMGYY